MLNEQVLTLDQYQAATRETAIYPQDQAHHYLYAKLLTEALELWNVIYFDSAEDRLPPDALAHALSEMGDCLWYCSEILTLLGEKFDYRPDPAWVSTAPTYLAAALMHYARQIADTWLKCLRDDGGMLSDEQRGYIALYIRYIVNYIDLLAKDFGTTLAEVTQGNLDKLASRKARGKLGGSGDGR